MNCKKLQSLFWYQYICPIMAAKKKYPLRYPMLVLYTTTCSMFRKTHILLCFALSRWYHRSIVHWYDSFTYNLQGYITDTEITELVSYFQQVWLFVGGPRISGYARLFVAAQRLIVLVWLYRSKHRMRQPWHCGLWSGARFTNELLPPIQIRWKLRLAIIPLLAIRSQQFFAHATVVPCTKCCSDHIIKIVVRVKRNFHRIWIPMVKSLVKRGPGLIYHLHKTKHHKKTLSCGNHTMGHVP